MENLLDSVINDLSTSFNLARYRYACLKDAAPARPGPLSSMLDLLSIGTDTPSQNPISPSRDIQQPLKLTMAPVAFDYH